MASKLKPYLVFGMLLVWGVITLIAQDGDALRPDSEIVAEQYLLVGSASPGLCILICIRSTLQPQHGPSSCGFTEAAGLREISSPHRQLA